MTTSIVISHFLLRIFFDLGHAQLILAFPMIRLGEYIEAKMQMNRRSETSFKELARNSKKNNADHQIHPRVFRGADG